MKSDAKKKMTERADRPVRTDNRDGRPVMWKGGGASLHR